MFDVIILYFNNTLEPFKNTTYIFKRIFLKGSNVVSY